MSNFLSKYPLQLVHTPFTIYPSDLPTIRSIQEQSRTEKSQKMQKLFTIPIGPLPMPETFLIAVIL